VARKNGRPKPETGPVSSREVAGPRGWAVADWLALLGTLLVSVAALHGVLRNGFLNWDDQAALVQNERLAADDVVAWAFTTTHMSHYQPLSWLAWASVRRALGAGPAVHHLASLLAHLAATALVFALAWRLASLTGRAAATRRAAALAAALVFGVHPLRVEAVAWASGLPYPLSLVLLLLSALAYLRYADATPEVPRFLTLSAVLYAVALLFRPVAPGFALLLLLLDWGIGRLGRVGWRRALAEKLPFALLALLATAAEASARSFAPLERVSLGARISQAALAPLVYLWRTLWPVGLSPLDPLPLEPRLSWPALLLGLGLLACVSLLAFRMRARWPALWLAWLAYLLLLAPALGLAPSGLQATADRYTYIPGVVVALLIGAGYAGLWAGPRQAPAAVVLALGVAALGVQSFKQVGFWRDSVTLWTRAIDLDPSNDVALYNLALALDEAGDDAAAEARYRRLLELIPEHDLARRNLGALEAARLEREAGALAASGQLVEAVALYGRALERDPLRLHSRRSRGMALAQLGRFDEALPDLRAAASAQVPEAAVAGALAFALARSGELQEAIRVLREAHARHPEDVGLAANLALLERQAAQEALGAR